MSDQRTKIIIETDAGRSEQVLRSVQKGLQDVGKDASKAGKDVKSGAGLMDSSFAKTALSAAALGAAIKTAYSMAKEASNLSEARLYLQTFSADMGVSYQKLDEATRKATNGLVDNLTLIRMNHKALKLGVSTDVNDLARLWQISDAVGDEFGQSIEQTFEQITNAIATGNAKALISLGLLPESFKRATDKASLLEQRVSMLKTVFEQAGAGADSLGKHGTTVNDKFTQMDVSVKNLKLSLGEGLIPVLMPTVEWLTQIATQIDEIINASNRLKGLNASQGEAGKLAGISEREYELQQQQKAIARAKKAESHSSAAGILESGGISVGWFEEIDKVIKKEETRIALELRSLATQKERVKLAGLDSAEKDRAAAAAKKEADELARAKAIEDTKRQAKAGGRNGTDKAQEALEKASQQAQKNLFDASVLQIKRELDLISELEDPLVKYFQAIELAEKATISLAAAIGSPTGASLFGALSDVSTAAFDAETSMYDGLVRIREEAAATEKTIKDIKTAYDLVQKSNVMLWNNPTSTESSMAAMNWLSGGYLTAGGGNSNNDLLKDVKEPLSKTIAEAVQTGFANADFSNLSLTLSNVLSTVISKVVAQSNPVMNAAGGINFGNLGVNLATNFVLGKLTGSGGIFGKRQEKFKEQSIAAATDLRGRMGEAYVNSYELSNDPYVGQYYKDAMAKARGGYFGTQVGYSWNDSGNGITSKKTRTYDVIDQGASAALAKLTEVMEDAERFSRSVERGYELQAARGYDYQTLASQATIYEQAARSAYNGIVGLNWTDGSKDTKDLSESAHELKIAAAEMARSLATATAERTTSTAQGFAQYAPWLNSIQMPAGMPSNLRGNMLGQYAGMAQMENLNVSQQYDAFSALQTSFMDRNISPYLLDMVKQAGAAKYDLEALKLTDSTAYAEKYLEYIEKQMDVYQEVIERQEQIFNNAAKSYEERSAALSAFEQANNAYYEAKLETLAAEQAAEEAVKAKQQEADARRIESLGSALSLVGEVSQRGDRIAIIQGGDVLKALRELSSRYKGDAEMLSVIQALTKAADDKAMWG